MATQKTGTRKVQVLGKTMTAAQWFHLSDTEREVFITAEKMLAHLASSDRSLIGKELGLPRFPGREDYVTWLSMPGNLSRGQAMLAKWWKRFR